MDGWQATQNWLIFGAVAAGAVWYYAPKSARPAVEKLREVVQVPETAAKKKQPARPKKEKRVEDSKANIGSQASAASSATASNDDASKKRKSGSKQQQQQPTPVVVVQQEDDDEVDMSTRQFAQQMMSARQGANLSAPKGQNQRAKTVKQGRADGAHAASAGSSQAGAEADDDRSPAASPALKAGDVSDMLAPKSSGPTSLRLTAPSKPQKEKVARQAKDDAGETKKQRQNRQKVEARRVEREAEEKQRKAQEEQQRRSAREARGEPAKNGIPVSKPPANNSWTGGAPSTAGASAPASNGTSSGPLLDTFDAESTGSSTGGRSTAATSTTEAGANDLSEEGQMAAAMKQSEDESGWTTVAQPKKQKKTKSSDGEGDGIDTPVEAPKYVAQAPKAKPLVNGKPKGFQALEDQYEQRADVDPNDAANWDA